MQNKVQKIIEGWNQLKGRAQTENTLRALGLPFDPAGRLAVAVIARTPYAGGHIVALRVNGIEHRLAKPLTPAQWEALKGGKS